MNKKLTHQIIGYAVATVLALWVIASFINVNMHNMSDGAYAVWNLFTLLFQKGEMKSGRNKECFK